MKLTAGGGRTAGYQSCSLALHYLPNLLLDLTLSSGVNFTNILYTFFRPKIPINSALI